MVVHLTIHQLKDTTRTLCDNQHIYRLSKIQDTGDIFIIIAIIYQASFLFYDIRKRREKVNCYIEGNV